MRRPVVVLVAAMLAVTALAGCGDDGDDDRDDDRADGGAAQTDAGPASDGPASDGPDGDRPDGDVTTTLPSEALAPLLLTEADLPGRFEPSDTVDDTLTTLCVNQDATAGLRATDRAVVGYSSEPRGRAVVQIVLELAGADQAATFVEQASELLETCDRVPDLAGLAFEYEPADPATEALLAAGTDAHVARRGTSVGSGDLVIDLAFFHHGSTAQLVAVLGIGQPPDELLATAVEVVLERSGRA